MFTGIIRHVATVAALRRRDGGAELSIETPADLTGTFDGDSIAANGVCLTVTSHGPRLVFDVVPETLSRTNLGALEPGDQVNLEPSLRLGDLVGGHMVYGHVDATCEIVGKDPEGQGFRLWCATPKSLRDLVVEKGYVSLDGVSLTVAAAQPDRFAVALIPETLKRTTLGRKGAGLSLNIEADPVARYIAAYLRDHLKGR